MEISILLFLIFFGILLFFFLREVFTWYWKINKTLEILERMDNNLEYIARILETKNPDVARKIHNTGKEVEPE